MAASRGVAALVVTYNPGPQVAQRITAIAAQVERLIAVDNASAAAAVEPVRTAVAAAGGELIANDRNLGIATALNQGARAAAGGGARWLLMLDQDTHFGADLVSGLLAAVAADDKPDEIGLIGPLAVNQKRRKGSVASAIVPHRLVMTSGSLLRLAAFERAGPFRDDFFIDMVDAEYALRLARFGYRVALAPQVRIGHRVGSPTYHTVLGTRVSTSNHPAWRRYYMSRNRIVVWRDHVRDAPAWVVFDALGMARHTLLMTLLEPDREQKWRATLRGAIDGLRGVTGPTVGPDDFRA